ncbi:hypothetical protein BKA63DRAFT_576011 [Paraphoma chrysanthemicola]|nr:hypothetical protein BKA63DRAFT_576011 [Paraphoma chrysanthemicola]
MLVAPTTFTILLAIATSLEVLGVATTSVVSEWAFTEVHITSIKMPSLVLCAPMVVRTLYCPSAPRSAMCGRNDILSRSLHHVRIGQRDIGWMSKETFDDVELDVDGAIGYDIN